MLSLSVSVRLDSSAPWPEIAVFCLEQDGFLALLEDVRMPLEWGLCIAVTEMFS